MNWDYFVYENKLWLKTSDAEVKKELRNEAVSRLMDFSVGWRKLWLKVEPGESSRVFVRVLFHSSIHLCLETNSFYWHCAIFGTALSAVLSCSQTGDVITACIVLRRLNSRLRGNKRIKSDFRSLFGNFGIICAHGFDLVNITQCHGLSCFAFQSFPGSSAWLCRVCSLFLFLSIRVCLEASPKWHLVHLRSAISTTSAAVVKQRVTNQLGHCPMPPSTRRGTSPALSELAARPGVPHLL